MGRLVYYYRTIDINWYRVAMLLRKKKIKCVIDVVPIEIQLFMVDLMHFLNFLFIKYTRSVVTIRMTTSTLVECQRLFIAYRDVRTYGRTDLNYLNVFLPSLIMT